MLLWKEQLWSFGARCVRMSIETASTSFAGNRRERGMRRDGCYTQQVMPLAGEFVKWSQLGKSVNFVFPQGHDASNCLKNLTYRTTHVWHDVCVRKQVCGSGSSSGKFQLGDRKVRAWTDGQTRLLRPRFNKVCVCVCMYKIMYMYLCMYVFFRQL